jgi:hypothetical protein
VGDGFYHFIVGLYIYFFLILAYDKTL